MLTRTISLFGTKLAAQGAGDQVFSARSGFRGHMENPTEVMLGVLLGSLVGFLVGMIAAAVVRFVRFDRVQSHKLGTGWGAYGAAAGSVGMAIWKYLD